MRLFHIIFIFLFFSHSISYIPEVLTDIPCDTFIQTDEQAAIYKPIVSIALTNGGWVLGWVGENLFVYFNMWSANGTKIVSAGSVITVPDYNDPGDKELRGCGLANGGFVISYRTGSTTLSAGFFDANGAPVARDVEVTTSSGVDWHYTSCTSSGDVWFSYSPGNTVYYLRKASSSGVLESEITAENGYSVSMTTLVEGSGGTLYSFFQAGDTRQVYLKSFTSNGNTLDAAIRVDTDSGFMPAISILGNGYLLLTWVTRDANNAPPITFYYRIYNGMTPVTSPTAIVTLPSDYPFRVYNAPLGTNKFVVITTTETKRVTQYVYLINGTQLDVIPMEVSGDYCYPYIHQMKNGDVIISYTYATSQGGNNVKRSYRYDTNLYQVDLTPCAPGGFDCSGEEGVCAGCLNGNFFFNSTCLATCPDPLVGNPNTTLCTLCPDHCTSCSSSTECILCENGYTISDGECIISITCPSTCDTCQNTTFCNTCKVNNYLTSSNLCEPTCPSNQYANATSRTCVPCTGNLLIMVRGTCVLRSSLTALTGVSLSCSSPANCGKYINQNNYIFTVSQAQISNYSDFDYTWTVSELTAASIARGIDQTLYIVANNFSLVGNNITIDVIAYNLTHILSASLVLELNIPPSGGQIVSSASTGQALITSFTFTTSGWSDSDSPLNYTFYYVSSAVRILIGPTGPSTSVSVVLPGNENNTQTVFCFATDPFGATSPAVSVTVTVTSPADPLDNIQLVDSLITGLTPDNPTQNIKTLAIASSQLSNLNKLLPTGNPCSSSCSGRGQCQPDNSCICNQGWTLDDCSLSTTKVDEIIAQKKQIFTLMGDNLKLLDSIEFDTTVMAAYDEGTLAADFADKNVLNTVVDILEQTLKINDPTTILTVEQSNSVANILNNMLVIQSKKDCGLKDGFSVALENRTNDYLETFSRNTLRDSVPLQLPENNVNLEFDLSTKILGLCDINNYEIKTSDNGPSIILNYQEPNLDCKKIVSLQYYVFRPNIFACRSNDSNLASPAKDPSKTLMAFETRIDGKLVNLSITASVRMPGSALCPNDCTTDPVTKVCFCQSLAPFDIKGQISRIFSASKLSLIGNFSVLLSFKYYEHVFFWLLLAYAGWYVSTIYLVYTRFKQYNVVQSYTKKTYKTWEKAIMTVFMIKNPMFNPCLHEDEKLAKMIRVTLYFLRGMLILAYNSIFSNVALSPEGKYVFSIYLIIIPYITYIPIMVILSLILKVETRKKLTTGQKIRLVFGSFVTFVVLVGCYLIVLILGAQSTDDERMAFAINFAITLCQDLIVNPAIGTTITFILYFIYRHGIKPLEKYLTHPKVRKGLEDAIGKEGIEVANYLMDYKEKIYKIDENLKSKFHSTAPSKLKVTRKEKDFESREQSFFDEKIIEM